MQVNNDIKQQLNQARLIQRSINFKLARIRQLRELAESATATWSDTRTSGAPSGSKLEHCIAAIDELEHEIAADILAMCNQERTVRVLIAKVPDAMQRQVLELRYLNNTTWEGIAVTLNYSWQHVHKIHAKALIAIGDSMRV